MYVYEIINILLFKIIFWYLYVCFTGSRSYTFLAYYGMECFDTKSRIISNTRAHTIINVLTTTRSKYYRQWPMVFKNVKCEIFDIENINP